MTAPSRRTGGAWSPFGDVDRIREEFDRLLGGLTGGAISSEGYMPSADLEETDDAYLVDVELPGVKRSDVDVELAGRRLVVTGERKEKERTGLVRRSTRSVGRFRYEVLLPGDVDDSTCDASFDEGVLSIRIPKVEAQRPRKIDIS